MKAAEAKPGNTWRGVPIARVTDATEWEWPLIPGSDQVCVLLHLQDGRCVGLWAWEEVEP